jgi:hypothetical protein
MDPPVLPFVDPNEPIPNKRAQVPGQRRPFKAKEVREAGGGHWAGLNQHRQQAELRASQARPPHRLFEGAG